jgi:hypothetical protein
MNSDSLAQRSELFFATAVIASHATEGDQGFRQRDVRFLIELFSNWVESGLGESVLKVQNTQISRYLSYLVREGYARQISRKGLPRYALTRTGLLEQTSRIVNRNYLADREQFFFLYYFISSYKPLIEELVKKEGQQFPYALKVELDALLDARALLTNELERAQLELKKLKARLTDAKKTASMTQSWIKSGKSLEQVINEAERLYPYELNSTKPLHELMRWIQPAQREWELGEGNNRRVNLLWQPSEYLLLGYIEALKKLASQYKPSLIHF